MPGSFSRENDARPRGVGEGISLPVARPRLLSMAAMSFVPPVPPGLCPGSADLFLQPFGPPVLQVSSEDAAWLGEQSSAGAHVRLVAQVKRTPATAMNVTTTISGTDPKLPPLVIMTPRSGWYACASERGGGIVCWLELMRTLKTTKPARDVLFVASSGHELGHLGINAFVDHRPGIVKGSIAWIHLGANIGAALDPGNT